MLGMVLNQIHLLSILTTCLPKIHLTVNVMLLSLAAFWEVVFVLVFCVTAVGYLT